LSVLTKKISNSTKGSYDHIEGAKHIKFLDPNSWMPRLVLLFPSAYTAIMRQENGNSSSVEWKDVRYREAFEEELRGLVRRRDSNPLCTVEEIEGVLQHLYIMDGADWYGRGDVQGITLAATIAAHEHFIAQWKAEK